MDPIRNPYVPGAGTPPPELSGRANLLAELDIALQRKLVGKAHKSLIFVGLRGVGKTVLLNRAEEQAKALKYSTINLEIREGASLAQMLLPALRTLLYELDRMEGFSEAVKRGFRVLKSFASKISLKFGDLDIGLAIDPEVGTADSGDLDTDLTSLITVVAEAARSRKVAIVLLIDEIQYLAENEFSALIMALHRSTQLSLPIIMVAAGLPRVRELAGKSKSYSERLFDYPDVGALTSSDANKAIETPAEREDVNFTSDALAEIYRLTRGYPYFLQEWAYQAWNAANSSPITVDDVKLATQNVIARLDESFFRVRFDRLTPAEKRFLRVMAELGPGPHRSSEIAEAYGAKSSSLGPLRSSLIRKGMIYSPAHGDAAFTVPLFDEFMKRIMSL